MGRFAGLVTAGVLGMGLMGCGGCDCPKGVSAGLTGTEAKRAELCTAVNELSNNLAPITTINPRTPVDQLQKVRTDVETWVPKVIDKQGLMGEDLRTSLKGAKNEFVQAVSSFGGTGTVGSAAPRFNESFQSIKGRVEAIKAGDCTQ